MSENIKEYFYTFKKIKAVWDENGWNGKGWSSDTISRKFKGILDGLGLGEKADWYKMETDEEGRGTYIFSRSETPREMKELFDLYFGSHELLTEPEIDRIADLLKKLLPESRNKDVVLELIKNLPEPDMPKKGFMSDPERKDQLLSELRSSQEKRWEIDEALQKYKARRVNPEYFEKRLFVTVDKKQITKETERREIYECPYRQIKKWHIKWKTILDDAVAARKAEQFEIENGTYLEQGQKVDRKGSTAQSGICEGETSPDTTENAAGIKADVFCEALMDIYGEDAAGSGKDDLDLSDVEKDGKGNSIEAWYDRCGRLVGEVLSHPLKGASEADFCHLVLNAFHELEGIHDLVLRRQYEWYYHAKGRGEREDVQKLSRIREKIDSKSRKLLHDLY